MALIGLLVQPVVTPPPPTPHPRTEKRFVLVPKWYGILTARRCYFCSTITRSRAFQYENKHVTTLLTSKSMKGHRSHGMGHSQELKARSLVFVENK